MNESLIRISSPGKGLCNWLSEFVKITKRFPKEEIYGLSAQLR